MKDRLTQRQLACLRERDPSAADIVDEIRFVRSPRIPEVLATGLLLTNRWSGNEVAIPSPGDSYLRSNNENYGYFFSPDHFLGGVSPYTDISNISFNLTGITHTMILQMDICICGNHGSLDESTSISLHYSVVLKEI